MKFEYIVGKDQCDAHVSEENNCKWKSAASIITTTLPSFITNLKHRFSRRLSKDPFESQEAPTTVHWAFMINTRLLAF